ncbi:MAG: 5-amino-6-(5-phosphoribosylamino)uracil reductase [Candidatus Dadabacteria bacterium]|nr:MAG: 5-amino-6-(5-phosphoribosylamino)uracil reductase [Candidatus Dadabacteria bacterium]
MPHRQRPYTILSVAQSIDGFIAGTSGFNRFSSDQDLDDLHKLRSTVGAIAVGIGTVLADNPRLTVRRGFEGAKPLRVVFDSFLRLPKDALVLNGEAHTVVFCGEDASPSSFDALGPLCEVVAVGKGKVDIKRALEFLASEKRVDRLLVEGGGKIIGSFLREDLADELRVSINPFICGEGVKMVSVSEKSDWGDKKGTSLLDIRFYPKSVQQFGHSVVITYLHARYFERSN